MSEPICERVQGPGCGWFSGETVPTDACDSGTGDTADTADTGEGHVVGSGLCATVGGYPGVMALLLACAFLRRS